MKLFLPESLAELCSRRPLVVIGLWAVMAVAALLIFSRLLDSATTTELKLTGNVESERAKTLLEERLGHRDVTEIVVIQSESLTVDDPAFQQRVQEVFGAIVALGPEVVSGSVNYYLTGDESLVSVDRGATIMPVIMAGDLDEAIENMEKVVHVTSEADRRDGFRVLIGGEASIAYENNELAEADLQKGERFGIPVAIIILLFIFGSLVAAFLPIGLAIVSIGVSLGIASLIGQVFELSFFVTLMITMIGLAIGIDYSLLIVSRFREEMRRGQTPRDAVIKAGETAGRTVLFSGFTVVFALCGMLIIPSSFFQSLGLGAIIVVLVTLAATFTLLPASLAFLGPRVNMLRLPFIGREPSTPRSGGSGGGFWDAITGAVTRFPIVGLVLVGGVMVAAAAFFFQIHTGNNGVDTFPEGSFTRDAFFILEEEGFSFGVIKPTQIVIDGDMNSPQTQEAIEKLTASIQGDPRFPLPPAPEVFPEANLAVISVLIAGEPRSQAAADAVTAIREQHIPGAFDGVPAEAIVGGLSASDADFRRIVSTYTPIVFAFVLGFSFILLMVVFRSLVIPIKAIIMNLLSVGAAYGLLVVVFQKGVGASLFGFQQTDVIDLWIPLFLFSILFGLSMDYHVFLLSRIKERYDQSGDNTEAVAFGLRSTAGIITGAAVIMVVVFGAFAAGETIINQQVGFGLAVAVFLDATLVRSVLVPASMEVLGARNWYLPPLLRWLPKFQIEPPEEPEAIQSEGR